MGCCCSQSATYWAAPTAADPEKRSATDNDREKPAQIQHINTQTNIEIQKFHVRDTTRFLQDDLGVQNQFHVDKNHIRCRQNSPEEPWNANTRAPNRLEAAKILAPLRREPTTTTA